MIQGGLAMAISKIVFRNILGNGSASWGASLGTVRLLNENNQAYQFGTLTNTSRTNSTFSNGTIVASDAYSSSTNYYVGYAFDNNITSTFINNVNTYYLSASKANPATITITFNTPINNITSITMNAKPRTDNGLDPAFYVDLYDESGKLFTTIYPDTYTLVQNLALTINTSPFAYKVKTLLSTMQIGDAIKCTYGALTANTVGCFSLLGDTNLSLISKNGTTTPSGAFYFVKVAKGLLVADRNIQTGVSWANLNTARYIEGTKFSSTLLSKADFNGSFLDSNGSSWTPTASAVISTSTVREGTGSLYTPAGHYTTLNKSSFATGTNDFTLEFWMYIPSTQSYCGVSSFTTSAGTAGILIQHDGVWIGYSGSSTAISSSSGYYVIGAWANYKLIRKNNVCYYFVDNVLKAQAAVTASINTTTFAINARYGSGSFSGSTAYYDNFSFYQGARLTDKDVTIRLITGGVAYNNASNSLSLTDENLGGYPPTNEWDTYIVNSTLNSTISAGSNSAWNYVNNGTYLPTWVGETPHLTLGASSNRVIRGVAKANGVSNQVTTTTTSGITGFRPVLEFTE